MSILAKANAFWRDFKAAQRGTTAVIFGVMVIPLIAMTGGVVDYGRAVKTKSQLATALDAAVLAAMKEYSLDKSSDYKKIIVDFVHKNLSEADKTYQGLELDITVPDIIDGSELTATVATNVSTHFLRLVGFAQFGVSVHAAATVGGKDLEVVLVLDNTGSMEGSKIEALKSASNNLLDILINDSGENRVKVALVPFAEYVNIGIDKRGEAGLDIPDDYAHPVSGQEYKWLGCMGSRKHDLNVTDADYGTAIPGIMMVDTGTGDDTDPVHEGWRCPSAPIVELTEYKSDILTGINDMAAGGWTYIPGGLAWGWRVLSNEAPFTSGVPDSELGVQKVIVLMTDGENTRAPAQWTSDATVNHDGEVWGHSKHIDDGAAADANLLTSELCENIKAKEIAIFTIAFEVGDGSEVETLMKDCAGNGGQFFDADNASELAEAFKQIGLSLLNMRLSQ